MYSGNESIETFLDKKMDNGAIHLSVTLNFSENFAACCIGSKVFLPYT